MIDTILMFIANLCGGYIFLLIGRETMKGKIQNLKEELRNMRYERDHWKNEYIIFESAYKSMKGE